MAFLSEEEFKRRQEDLMVGEPVDDYWCPNAECYRHGRPTPVRVTVGTRKPKGQKAQCYGCGEDLSPPLVAGLDITPDA